MQRVELGQTFLCNSLLGKIGENPMIDLECTLDNNHSILKNNKKSQQSKVRRKHR